MTPLARRRILAVVVLAGLLALAALVGSREASERSVTTAPPATDATGPTVPPRPSVADVDAVVPTASPPGAFSTTWYCVGGSGAADGAAPATIELTDRSGKVLRAEVSAYGSDGTTAHRQVEVPAGSRVEVAASDVLAAPSVATVVEAQGGGLTVGQRYSAEHGAGVVPCASRAATQWYFAGGSTDRGAGEDLVVFNPFPDSATVDVTFFLADGLRRPDKFQGIPVAGGSVAVLRVADVEDRIATLGAAVTTRTGRVVAARVQSFDGSGPDGVTGAPPEGLSVTLGNPWASEAFVLPDGSFADGLATQVVVLNPGPTDSEVRLTFSLDQPDVNGQPTPVNVSVPANSWKALGPEDLRQLPPGVPFTVRGQVTLGGPVVAESWLYGTGDSQGKGVAVTTSVPVAATDWVFPAATGPTRADRLSLVSTGREAEVTLSVVEAGGRHPLALPPTVASGVGPGGRASIDLKGLLGERPGAILLVHADAPVVVSRSWFAEDGDAIPVLVADPVAGTTRLLAPTG